MNILRQVMTMLCFCVLTASAQSSRNDAEVSVEVTVVDVKGDPLVGATVKGSDRNVGVAADADGKASLWVRKGSNVTISYLGMKPRTIRISRPFAGVVTLENDENILEQVVVTGYTQSDIRKSTGSVSIISGKDLNDSPLKNVDMLLQGKLAGVNVQALSGRPGESAKVRIRGVSSITGSSEPLWVVDGVPIQKNIPASGSSYIRSGDFSTLYANGVAGINPQSIESITVLKDASASAIYGSQAQAGVIVITTKKGVHGRMRIDYSGSLSIQTSPVRDASLMNSSEKLAYEQSIWDEFSAGGFASGGYYPVVGVVGMIRSGYGRFAGWTKDQQEAYISELGKQSTDWFGELFHNSVSTSHNISASGGSDKHTYFVSGGITTNNGLVKRTSSDAYNFSVKLSGTPSSTLSYNASVDFSYLKSLSPSQSFNIFKYAYFANPYERLYKADGSYAADETFFSLPYANGASLGLLPSNGINVMREIENTKVEGTSNSTVLRTDLTWRAFKGFRLYGLASATFSNDDSRGEIDKDTYAAWLDRPFEGVQYSSSTRTYGSLTQSSTSNLSWLVRLQANYSVTLHEVHHLSALAGTEVRYNRATSMMGKMYGYDSVTGNHVTPYYLGSSVDGKLTLGEQSSQRMILDALNSRQIVENTFASFYGALDYVYNNKYVWNATMRSDGSNNFGSKEQFNLTWSTGLAWNIDEETFFQGLKPILSRATLRVSTGLTGGVNKSVYPQLIMNYSNEYRSSDNGTYRIGYINNAPNPKLRWEHTRDYNGSLDIGFLNNRLGLYVSAYRRKGYDLVTPVAVVSTTGFRTQSYNTTEQINQGFEVTLNAVPLKLKDFTWNVSTNIAYNQNYISKYDAPNNSYFADIVLNYPQGAIFAGKYIGINAQTGIYNYMLRPGADTSVASELRDYRNYVYYIGTANAPWTGGLSTHVAYKNLSISVNTSFSLGSKISNLISEPYSYSNISSSVSNTPQTSMSDLYTAFFNKPKDAAHRWTSENPVTDGYPRLMDAYGTYLGLDLDQTFSSSIVRSAFYESGSYLKVDALTLAYSFTDKLVQKIGLSSVGLSFTANNLLMVTGYSGLNPETPGAVYPISRSFSFGLNIGL